jgi:hypothetical protein
MKNTTGKPLPPLGPLQIARFWSRVAVKSPCECWDWQHRKLPSGYGVFSIGNRSVLSHRVAYYLINSVQPGPQLVCHRCDNPSCCNPVHLFLGTSADNIHDMDQKGRGNRPKGYLHAHARLTAKDVCDIRTSKESYAALSRKYGVSECCIGCAARGVTWKHIKTSVVGSKYISEDTVRAIRREHTAGVSQTALKIKYNMSDGNISLIVNYKTWKHVV